MILSLLIIHRAQQHNAINYKITITTQRGPEPGNPNQRQAGYLKALVELVDDTNRLNGPTRVLKGLIPKVTFFGADEEERTQRWRALEALIAKNLLKERNNYNSSNSGNKQKKEKRRIEKDEK